MNEQLKKALDECRSAVFFGGAGVSTESGIPDFRSVDGLYNQKYKYPPETILSHTFFMQKTAEFYDFYREKMICTYAKPNRAHIALAELERAGKLKAVVTQRAAKTFYKFNIAAGFFITTNIMIYCDYF